MEETFKQFAEKMVNEINHPVTVICYADAYMSKYLKDKPNWNRVKTRYTLQKRYNNSLLLSSSLFYT